MKKKIFVFLFDGFSDWEISYVTPEIHKKENFEFVFFGRLGISKGLDLLLPAYKIIADSHPNARLTLVLPRNPKMQLRYVHDQLSQMETTRRPVIFHELSHDQLVNVLTAGQCIVIPSYSEGFGYTAVESMALNIPIISSGRGSLKEVVGGNMIEMKSQSVEGLVEAMRRAMEESWEYKEPTKFQLSDTVDEYIKLYQHLANLNKDADNHG